MNKIEMIKIISLLGIFVTSCVFSGSNDVRKTRFSHPGQEGRFGGRFDPTAEKKIEAFRKKIKTMPSIETEEEAIKVLDSLLQDTKDIISAVKTIKNYQDFKKYAGRIIEKASKFESEKIKLAIKQIEREILEKQFNVLNEAAKELYNQNTDLMSDNQYKEWNNKVTELFEKTKFFAFGEQQGEEATEDEKEIQATIEEFNKLSQKALDASAKRGKPTGFIHPIFEKNIEEEKPKNTPEKKAGESSQEEQKLIRDATQLEKDLGLISKGEYDTWAGAVNSLLSRANIFYKGSQNVPNIFQELYKKLADENKQRKYDTLDYNFLQPQKELSLEETTVAGMTEKERVDALESLVKMTPQEISKNYENTKRYFHALINKLQTSSKWDNEMIKKMMDFDIKLENAETLSKKK